MSSSSNNTIINPKSCNYGCNIRIYWNTSENAYFEVFSGNRHQCPNRSFSTNNKSSSVKETSSIITNKPKYYSNYNKFSNKQQPKPKMSNSLELLQGPIADVQKKYEILSDIVSSEANGHVFGSQSHISHNNNELSIVVYFEVPQGRLNEFKQRFHNNTKLILQHQNNHIHR
jgi:hypothetical protein